MKNNLKYFRVPPLEIARPGTESANFLSLIMDFLYRPLSSKSVKVVPFTKLSRTVIWTAAALYLPSTTTAMMVFDAICLMALDAKTRSL